MTASSADVGKSAASILVHVTQYISYLQSHPGAAAEVILAFAVVLAVILIVAIGIKESKKGSR
jgi:hypothetical protein